MVNKILVVDDEVNIADAIAYALRREGHMVEVAYDGKNALSALEKFNPDLMLLDVMLPEKNGFDVIRSINEKNKVGIILLTAKNDIVDKVLGLELGADDYVTKPFDMRELMAMVNSLLRRTNINIEKQVLQQDIIIKDLQVLFSSRKVIVKGLVLDLTPKEFDLLFLLLSNIDRVFTRDELLDRIWGMDYAGGTRTVDIHIQRLRKKLGENYQDAINTVHGVGYKAEKEFYEN
ncbi:MAG TPA: response regulator transcription factor [Clostridia bacterium]